MNPSDANSPLATLRQLKEMLDAGTLTPQEFEALKQKLIFGNEPGASVTPVSPIVPAPYIDELPHTPPTPLLDEEAPVILAPTPTTEWPMPAASLPAESTHYTPPTLVDEVAEQRNPLTLVFAIGGALLVLALVLYLALGNRSSDEHVTSISQTAADSTAVAPEVGPQAQQITLPPATAPETVRVAPAVPLPAASSISRDSVAASAPTATTAPATATPATAPTTTAAPVVTPTPAKPTPKPTSTPPAAPTDTAASKSSQP